MKICWSSESEQLSYLHTEHLEHLPLYFGLRQLFRKFAAPMSEHPEHSGAELILTCSWLDFFLNPLLRHRRLQNVAQKGEKICRLKYVSSFCYYYFSRCPVEEGRSVISDVSLSLSPSQLVTVTYVSVIQTHH